MLSQVAAVAIGALISISGASSIASALSFPSVGVSNPQFLDPNGQEIGEARNSQQIIISESVKNDAYPDDKSMTLLVEIRDQEDVTIYLAWQSTVVAANQTYSFGSSWTIPDAHEGKSFSVRTFAIGGLGDKPEPLSTVVQRELIIS